jgi:hypothetical protein
MAQKYGACSATKLQLLGNTDLSLTKLIRIESKSFLISLDSFC